MPKRLSSLEMIKEMHQDIKEVKEKLIPELDKKVAVIEVKSSIFGTLGGLVAGLSTLLLPHR